MFEQVKGEERMSKKIKALFAAASIAAGLMAASSAQATILVKSTRTTVTTGGDALFDVIRFYGQVQAGGTETAQGATGIQSVAVTMTALEGGQFKFGFTDRTADGIPDWDPVRIPTTAGTASSSPLTDNANVNTFIASRPYDAAANAQGGPLSIPNGLYAIYPTPGFGDGKAPPQDSSDNDGDNMLSPGDFDPRTIYQSPLVVGFQTSPGLKQFRVEMFNATVDPSAMPGNANYNRGALFAVAVVPHLQSVNITGSLAADKGDQTAVNYTDAIPEPASIGLLGLGAVGFLARRRRQA